MSWTDERIDQLKTMWEKGLTASQIAEELGGVSRNAVIGKAHRLGLKSRPSPVKAGEAKPKPAKKADAPKPAKKAEAEPESDAPPFKTDSAAQPVRAAPAPAPAPTPAPRPVEPVDAADDDEETGLDAGAEPAVPPKPQPRIVSVGPGGFLRQGPGDQQAPIPPAPPRRLVPARPSAEIAGKTSLLDLSDRICRWPMGHPGEPDFHFCGQQVNPGFPYCVEHCGRAYQAQLPRGTRRPPPPMPFGGPRVR
ncbi:GcrA family cell cycle regulator [Blastomonas sp.]|uniref:GcrA family cell cycle regulator n=1 Tax=Blastomonas sp. TaxID=1909299 RepID=UPI00261D319D|nr:GcrA family cell cycle regulator [Blastomonas sp.]MDM7957066.1 GcrA family cell cycle regulator [Blastomonas sp.]